jgi:DNA-binding protein HU-beta
MAKQSIQGFVELASGLGELTKSRALEAANELLALTGLEGSSKKMGQQAAAFADEMMSAAETNRKQLVELVRTEIDVALGRVDLGRLAADVNAVTAAVTALAGQLEEVATMVAVRAGLATTEVAEPYVEPAPAQPSRVAATGPAKKATAKRAPAKRAPAKKATAKKATAKKATAKKATAKKATAKKATAKKAPAGG